jgi:hypothetical protein
MMTLPRDFHFSQHNLQDYVDCARRFELRHLLRLEWPAVQSAPVIEQELRMERGTQFHRMVQQWLHGIPADLIEQRASDPNCASGGSPFYHTIRWKLSAVSGAPNSR